MQANLRFSAALFTALLLLGGNRANAQTAEGRSAAQWKENNALLVRASNLYYSYAREGLAGFDCNAQPDWGMATDGDGQRLALLNKARMRLHARFGDGDFTLQWTAPPNAPDSAGSLQRMHDLMDHVLTGFLEYWSPFIDDLAIPADADGVEIQKRNEGYQILFGDGPTRVVEKFDATLRILSYEVSGADGKALLTPSYEATPKGLLVNHFEVHMPPPNGADGQEETMLVDVDYQLVEGFELPSQLRMDLFGGAKLNVLLNGCAVVKEKDVE